jgi:hypothetical protein
MSKTLTRNHVSTNANASTRLAPQATLYPQIRVDADVIQIVAGTLAGLFRRLHPDRYAHLVGAALRRRAYANLRLAMAADDPEDRQLGVLWEKRQPKVVHWEVSGEAPASPENVTFSACGRHGSILMRDPSWVHSLERDRPISCRHCKALMQAASDAS